MDAKFCFICNEKFDYKSGKFTSHLMKEHNLKLKDYIIKYEMNDIRPICKCGFCNDEPEFYRGKFLNYKSGHYNFDWQKDQWIKKYGKPVCPTCGRIIEKWFRGKPNKYCCLKCKPNCWNQETVNKTVKEKYGVKSILQLDEIKNKIKKTNKKRYGSEYVTQSKKIIEKRTKNNILKYGVKSPTSLKEVQDKMKKTCFEKYGIENPTSLKEVQDKMKKTYLKNLGVDHPSKLEKNRKKSSKRMKNENPMFDDDVVKKVSETNINNLLNGKYNFYKNSKYKNTKLLYQSSYEYDFLELCEKLNILNKINNGNVYKYNNCDFGYWMLTDFSLENYEIEIKSTYIMEKQGGEKIINLKRTTVEENDKKYILILDKDYSEFLFLVSHHQDV